MSPDDAGAAAMMAGSRVWQHWRAGGGRGLMATAGLLCTLAVTGLTLALLWWPPPPAPLLTRLVAALAGSGLLLAGCLRLLVWLRADEQRPAETANAVALGVLAGGGLVLMAAGGPVVTAVVGWLTGPALLGGALVAAVGLAALLALGSQDLKRLVAADSTGAVASPDGPLELAGSPGTPVFEGVGTAASLPPGDDDGTLAGRLPTHDAGSVVDAAPGELKAAPSRWAWLDSRWTLAVLVGLVIVAGGLASQRLGLLNVFLGELEQPSPAAGVAPVTSGQAAVAPPLVDLAAGEIRTLVGAGGATGQPLSDPRGLATGPGGQLYVVETGARQVVEFNASGAVVRRWGGAGQGAGQFEEPVAVAVDASGAIHVADAQRNTIQVFGPDGRFRRVYGAELGLYRPRGLAAGDDGRMYVADTGRNRVLALTEAGTQEEVIPPNFDTKPPPIDQPTMAIAAGDVVYVAEPTRARLLRLNADGASVGPPWVLTATDTLISARLTVGPAGEVIVAEVGARRVLVICPDADRVLAWKMPDGTAEPRAAALGPDGTLYVVDAEGRLLATRLSRRC